MKQSAAERSARHRAKDVEAYRSKKAEYARTPEQRQKRTEYMRTWREKNREKHNASARLSHQKNKHKHVSKVREYHLQRKYGITSQDYEEMVAAQGDRCKICLTDKPTGQGRWHVDHCHTTGRVRGLLCHSCNTKLGWYERLKASIGDYLQEE